MIVSVIYRNFAANLFGLILISQLSNLKTSGFIEKGIRKLEFVAKPQFLCKTRNGKLSN